jgi:hypothetical protein
VLIGLLDVVVMYTGDQQWDKYLPPNLSIANLLMMCACLNCRWQD